MTVSYEKTGNIAYLTLNRPEAMNALDPETFESIKNILDKFDADDDMRVAIITGAGEKAFCAGADLKKTMPPVGEASQSVAAQFWKKGWQDYQPGSLFERLESVSKPIIAAINGYCLAGGLEIAVRCDIRVASENAMFGEPEVQVGSVTAGPWLSLVMPVTAAMKMLLTADMIDARQALQWGLVSDVVPLSELMPVTEKIARRIADNAPLSIKGTKAAVMNGLGLPLGQGMMMESLLYTVVCDSEDRIEGLKALVEKRKPEYRGR